MGMQRLQIFAGVFKASAASNCGRATFCLKAMVQATEALHDSTGEVTRSIVASFPLLGDDLLLLTRLAAGAAFIIGCIWVWRDPKIESIAAAASAFVVLVGLFVVPKLSPGRQKQEVSGGSTGIQAGGDVHVGSMSSSDQHDVRR